VDKARLEEIERGAANFMQTVAQGMRLGPNFRNYVLGGKVEVGRKKLDRGGSPGSE